MKKSNEAVSKDIYIVGPENSKFKGFVFRCRFSAYIGNTGIGPYEFWGDKGYDEGHDYVEEWTFLENEKPVVYKMDQFYANEEYPENLVLDMANDKDVFIPDSKMSFKDFCIEIGEDETSEDSILKELEDLLADIDENGEINDAVMDNLDEDDYYEEECKKVKNSKNLLHEDDQHNESSIDFFTKIYLESFKKD